MDEFGMNDRDLVAQAIAEDMLGLSAMPKRLRPKHLSPSMGAGRNSSMRGGRKNSS